MSECERKEVSGWVGDKERAHVKDEKTIFVGIEKKMPITHQYLKREEWRSEIMSGRREREVEREVKQKLRESRS